MMFQSPFDDDILAYELFVETYQDLVSGKTSLMTQEVMEEIFAERVRCFDLSGLDCSQKLLHALQYGRELYLKRPSKKVHKKLMAYQFMSPQEKKKLAEEKLRKETYQKFEKVCNKHPSIALDILNIQEEELLDMLDHFSASRFSSRMNMLKLSVLHQVRDEFLSGVI